MKPRIIKDEASYEQALSHVDDLMDAKPGSKEEEELELWSLLIEQYEKEWRPPADAGVKSAYRLTV